MDNGDFMDKYYGKWVGTGRSTNGKVYEWKLTIKDDEGI